MYKKVSKSFKKDNCLWLNNIDVDAKQRMKIWMQTLQPAGKKSYMHIKESQIRFLTKTNKLDGFMNHVNSSIFLR